MIASFKINIDVDLVLILLLHEYAGNLARSVEVGAIVHSITVSVERGG